VRLISTVVVDRDAAAGVISKTQGTRPKVESDGIRPAVGGMDKNGLERTAIDVSNADANKTTQS
jgi:hypothetical protein